MKRVPIIFFCKDMMSMFTFICWQSITFEITQHDNISYHLFAMIWNTLIHWGWVTHICVSKLTIIGSDNGLLHDCRQAIIWTNVGILLIGPLGTNFSEILIEIHAFAFKKIHLNMSSGKWLPFCLGLNVLKCRDHYIDCSIMTTGAWGSQCQPSLRPVMTNLSVWQYLQLIVN